MTNIRNSQTTSSKIRGVLDQSAGNHGDLKIVKFGAEIIVPTTCINKTTGEPRKNIVDKFKEGITLQNALYLEKKGIELYVSI